MVISVIIPALNEERYIGKTLNHLSTLKGNFEIIVVDGGSKDSTCELVNQYPAVKVFSSEKGRAAQMNTGALNSQGEILLFLHADTILPQDAYMCIVAHFYNPHHIGGSFILKLDKKHFLLQLYSWCSRWSAEFFTYGDHAIFMKKEVFVKIGGYKQLPFMEDVEIQKRLRKVGKFKKLKCAVLSSARRFEKVGVIKQFFMDVLLIFFYKTGVPLYRLKQFYKDHC
ncbi:TIGR04283 family arsenosugar biosynthesis glycosyltransferase [soil metagenome]